MASSAILLQLQMMRIVGLDVSHNFILKNIITL